MRAEGARTEAGFQARGVPLYRGMHFWYYWRGWLLGTPGIGVETGQHSCPRRREMKRIVLVTVAILFPVGTGAQEKQKPPESGMVMEAGEWRAPTPATALRALLDDADGLIGRRDAAIAVLRQRFGTFSAAELDAFADDLASVMRDGTDQQATDAHMALIFAAATYWPPERGVPYAGATRAFVRLYESYDDSLGHKADGALYGVMRTGGVEYVRRLFEASEQPPPCQYPPQTLAGPRTVPENPCPNVCMWCQAGGALVMSEADGAPAEDLWTALCVRLRY